jgi:hypothetical protein
VLGGYTGNKIAIAGLTPLSNGKVVVLFTGTTTSIVDFIAAERRNADGTLDTTFGALISEFSRLYSVLIVFNSEILCFVHLRNKRLRCCHSVE